MKTKLVIVYVLMWLVIPKGIAQTTIDSIHQLPVFTVHENRINRYACGLLIEKIDSTYLQPGSTGSFADVLSLSTVSYIKTTGPGSLTSFSLRGSSVQQTSILWNGMDIRAPGAGMIDLALIPGGFFESVEILHGGAGAICGNGVIGGSLLLNTNPDFTPKQELEFGMNLSSFHGNAQHLHIKWSSGKHYLSTAVFRSYSLNNFKYNLGAASGVNKHARADQKGILQSFHYKFTNKLFAGYSIWIQGTDREIAPSIMSSDYSASREDVSVRFLPTLQITRNHSVFQLKGGLLHDYLHYLETPGDTIRLLDSRITNDILSCETEYSLKMTKGYSFSTGANIQSLSADIGKNGGKNTQLQSAFVLNFRKEWTTKWILSMNLRHQMTEGYKAVPAPSLGLEWNFSRLRIRANTSRNFRVPSLNDRFWQPGSNKDLKPEISFNTEAGLDYSQILAPSFQTSIHTTAFRSDVNDWIAWVPGISYWTVQNIQRVVNRGIETNIEFRRQSPGKAFWLSCSYTFTRSTYEKELYPGDLTFRKQLIYNPSHRFAGVLGMQIKSFTLYYQHGYTGRTYVSSDNTDFLPVYDVANLTTSVDLKIIKMATVKLRVEIMNLWEKDYQVVAYYPMPGRWIRAGLTIKFNIPNPGLKPGAILTNPGLQPGDFQPVVRQPGDNSNL